ncbi:YtxH domain-containing protein [Flavobacterium muglaense]|uniref:YtxH domain-containing protein n=1 Tax=Flavobacterium muglaense TaxID=2764716 RepID=A0A923N3H6_9FLAO|nr:YtxH domain-containing protein [Flavobacterium muglaense]MBC5838885.1 YtxH domain-containing protein [Flavobacterium muglaense]MBC5845375.1 YtxH domain-containing protein [Flavobacterium muglaense]
MKNNKVILGVLSGFAAGAILGILYAPDKGEKTRKKIKRKSQDYADDLKDKYESSIETLSKKYETLKKDSKELIAEGKSKIDSAKKHLENSEN